jgi:hypothetical protein
MPIYTRNQAKRQRTDSVAKRIPMVLLTNIMEMKHEMEVAEWREEHKQQFAPMLDVIERMELVWKDMIAHIALVWNTIDNESCMRRLIRILPASWSSTRFGSSLLVFHPTGFPSKQGNK